MGNDNQAASEMQGGGGCAVHTVAPGGGAHRPQQHSLRIPGVIGGIPGVLPGSAATCMAFLGGSRVQIAGPTSAFIVIIYGIVQRYGYDGLAVATLIAGIILVLMGLAKLGTLLKFVPYPLTVGFTMGIALIIFTSQLNDFFGLHVGALPADFV